MPQMMVCVSESYFVTNPRRLKCFTNLGLKNDNLHVKSIGTTKIIFYLHLDIKPQHSLDVSQNGMFAT